jgi:hypothetical protein
MSKTPIKDKTITLSDGKVVRLQKWSVKKWFTIVADIGDVVDEVTSSQDGPLDTGQFIAKIVVVLCNSTDKAVRVICESLKEDVGGEEVLQWEMEDFLEVLDGSLKLNLTPSLEKKLQSVVGRIFKATEKSQAATAAS